MADITIDDVDLEKNIVTKNNTDHWDKCCYYTGISTVVLVIGTFTVILVYFILQSL